MATYEELELDADIIELIEEKSSEPGFAELITPEGLKAWIAAGGNMAREIKGINAKSAKKVHAALDLIELPPPPAATEQKQEPPVQTPVATEQKPEAPVEPESTPEVKTVEAKPPEPQPEIQYVDIRLPIGPMPTKGYDVQQAQSGKLSVSETGSRHLQMRLRPEEAMVFLRIREGIRLTNERLADGRPAWNTPDVQRIIAAKVLSELGE